MSDLYDVEEADREAAERLRVHEWATEHQNPLTAALQRAESAEARADRAEALLERAGRTADQVRDQTLREVEAHGQFVYDYETAADDLTFGPPVIHVARRRLVMDEDGERS